MSSEAASRPHREKEAMPPLPARAPRPTVIRLRRGVVVGMALAAASLCSGALAWAFIVRPELRAETRELSFKSSDPGRDQARPNERIAQGPASYGELDHLPEPRKLNAHQSPDAKAAPAAVRTRPRSSSGSGQDARKSGLFFERAAAERSPSDKAQAINGMNADYAAVYNTHSLLDPLSPYEVKAGAVIPAVLLTGLDTARSGAAIASVTENVYDTVSGRHLVIPQGSRLIGRHEGESRYGDRRAFVAWDRLVLPNGKSLVLAKEPGVDIEGAIGLKGKVDRRILPLAVASLFAGAITTLGEIARDDDDGSGGWLGDAGDAASIEAAQVGGRLIDRELQVRPSVRLRPGARVRVLITRDLILEPYRR